MGLLKLLDCGFAVTVRVPDSPAGIVSEAGVALRATPELVELSGVSGILGVGAMATAHVGV